MWHSFKDLIPKTAGKYQLQGTLKAFEVFQAFRQAAEQFLLKGWEEEAIPQHYKEAILTIGVKNSMWAQELAMKKHLILEYIKTTLGQNTVKSIKVVLIEVPEC